MDPYAGSATETAAWQPQPFMIWGIGSSDKTWMRAAGAGRLVGIVKVVVWDEEWTSFSDEVVEPGIDVAGVG